MSKHSQNTVISKNATVIVLMLILIIIGIISGVAYSRYVSKHKGNVTAEIAKIICLMDVKSSSEDNSVNVITPADKTVINPYCIVTVKNYNGDISNPTEVTQTDISYTITVKPKEENAVPTFTMPQYNWYEISSPSATSGTKVATSPSELTGKLTHNSAQNKYYKIVFLNSGEQDITRYVDFEIKAVQDNAQ